MVRQLTSDGAAIKVGLRVFTINCRWGTVATVPDTFRNNWFYVDEDDAGRCLLNGERVATRNNITGTPDPKCAS